MKIHEFYKQYRWVQEKYICDREGNTVYLNDSQAYGFCLAGAIDKVYKDELENKQIRRKILSHLNTFSITYWNDVIAKSEEDVISLAMELDI